MGLPIPLVIAAYNDAMVAGLTGPLHRFLRPNDEVDLVVGNRDHPLSVPTLNRWAEAISTGSPPGVRLAAHTSSLEKVAEVARSADPAVASILLDYEPQWDPSFTWEFAPTLAHFDQFAAICRNSHRQAIAYPTGRPLLEGPLQRYAWDYGEIRRRVDDVYPQTQHWASLGSDRWRQVIERLRSQWARAGLPENRVTVQVTIGNRENGVGSEVATMRVREAVAMGVGRLYVWWAPDVLDETARFLAGVESLR
jgi:hypothetical protein